MAITAATATALMLASCASAPEPTALATLAIEFYENEPIGIDLTCEGMAEDLTTLDQFFDGADIEHVGAAINARAEKEECVAP